MKGHQEIWLPEGHYVVEFDYWPADKGDRENAPMGCEVCVTSVMDMAAGVWIDIGPNPEFFERLAKVVEKRLSEPFEEQHL